MRSRVITVMVLLSVASALPGSSISANGGPTCAISPDQVQVTIDRSFFEVDEPPDVELPETQEMFDPPSLTFDTAAPGSLWARFTLTLGGKTYADEDDVSTPMIFPVGNPYPSAIAWFAAFLGSWQYIEPVDADFRADFPAYASYVDAFMDPRNYPITYRVTYSTSDSGPVKCSLLYEFDVGAGFGGFDIDIDMDHYLERAAEEGSALPDTV